MTTSRWPATATSAALPLGQPYQPATKPAIASYNLLNTLYYSEAPATIRPKPDPARRIVTFDEIEGGFDESTALFEARRCLSCGICVAECPSGAIEMNPEQT